MGVEDNDNDNDTQKSPINVCQRPGLTSVSEGVMTPRKKSVRADGTCTIGKVCNWHIVDDSVQSHQSQRKNGTN